MDVPIDFELKLPYIISVKFLNLNRDYVPMTMMNNTNHMIDPKPALTASAKGHR